MIAPPANMRRLGCRPRSGTQARKPEQRGVIRWSRRPVGESGGARVVGLHEQAYYEERQEPASDACESVQGGQNAGWRPLALNEGEDEDDRRLSSDIAGAARAGLEDAADPDAHEEGQQPGQ